MTNRSSRESTQMSNFPGIFENEEEFDFGVLADMISEEDGSGGMKGATKSSTSKMPTNVTDDDANGDEDGGSDEDGMDNSDKRGNKAKSPNKRRASTIDRRRERNRVLARKTRLRKKFFFESLQVQVTQLVTENKNLKQLVKDNLEEDISARLLMECNCDIPTGLKSSTQKKPEAQNQALTSPTGTLKNVLHDNDYELYSTIRCAQRSFIITDPSLPDNPIMFASPGFLALSKYSLEEVIGRNCRFMQGPHTDTNEVEKLRKGINDGVDTSVVLLNYKKDGTAFYNQIFVAGLRNATGKIINYVGVQSEVKLAGRKGRNGAPAVASPQHKSSGAGQAGSSGTTARTSKRGRTQRSSSSRDTVSAEATGSGIGMGMTDDGSDLGLITGPAVSINGAQVDHIQSGALPPLPASSSSPAQGIMGLSDGFSLYGGTPSDFRFTLIGDDPRRSRSNSLSFPPPMTDTLPQGVVGSQMDVSHQGEGQTETGTGTGTGTGTKGDVLSEEEDVKMEVREVSPRDLHSPALPG